MIRNRLVIASIATLLAACSSQSGGPSGSGGAGAGASTTSATGGGSRSGASTGTGATGGTGGTTTTTGTGGTTTTTGTGGTTTTTGTGGTKSTCAPASVVLGPAVAVPSGLVDGFVVADVNKDGKPDIVVSSGQAPPGVSVLMNKGDGTFAAPVTYAAGEAGNALAVADFSGSGAPDIITGGDDTDFTLLINKGDGTFPTQSTVLSLASGSYQKIVAADFNGDGLVDFVASDAVDEGSVFVHLNSGDAMFVGTGTAVSVSTGAGMTTGKMRPGALPDLVVGNTGGACIVFNAGGQLTSAPVCTTYTGNGDMIDLAVGDVNGDGIDDLVMNETVYVNSGTGTFAAGVTYPLPVGIGTYAVALADVNNDTHLDIVVAASDSNVYIYLGNGDGTFSMTPNVYSAGPTQNSVPQLATGDFKGNGLIGVAVPDDNHNQVDILEATCAP